MCDQTFGALLPIPPFLEPYVWFNPESAEFGYDAEGRRCLAVDACMAPALLALWEQGIPTISACCLHGAGEGVITLPRIHDPSQPPPKPNWLLLEETRAALAASEQARERLAGAGSTLFACIETTEDLWMNDAGTYEIGCLCCGAKAIGNRNQQAVIEHLSTCDVLGWRAALAAQGGGGAGEP